MVAKLGCVALLLIVTAGSGAQAQTAGPPALESPPTIAVDQPADATSGADGISPNRPGLTFESALVDWILSPLSQQEDPDGSIDTDRPTFTPAHTVVPLGRLQFESGFTFDNRRSPTKRVATYDFPELAVRLGVADRVEFRTFWFGQTYSQTQANSRGPTTALNGPGDMEIGFKWQLIKRNEEVKWIPTTALITSIFAPTGGTSPFSSETVDPYINLIYGWRPTDKLTFCGSTGYLGRRSHFAPRSGRRSDSFERYHQSLASFYSATERTSLFYEWYILMPTESADNRPMNFMDGGVLYHPTPNTQFDLRVGFGLNGHQDEIFTGAGFSVRF
jgi:hypothetical protein